MDPLIISGSKCFQEASVPEENCPQKRFIVDNFLYIFKNIFKGRVALDNQSLYLSRERLAVLFLYIL